MSLVKAVRPAQQTAGGKWPPILVIAPFDENVFGKFFIAYIVIDNRNRSFTTDVLIIAGDIILLALLNFPKGTLFNRVKITNIDHDLTEMMFMDLFFIVDKLTSLLGIASNISNGHG